MVQEPKVSLINRIGNWVGANPAIMFFIFLGLLALFALNNLD